MTRLFSKWWAFLVGRPAVSPEPAVELPKEPPDPATVSDEEDKWRAVDARVDAGLVPWPSLSPYDYLNSVNGVCDKCGRSIYGGMAISWGWDDNGNREVRCGRCFKH